MPQIVNNLGGGIPKLSYRLSEKLFDEDVDVAYQFPSEMELKKIIQQNDHVKFAQLDLSEIYYNEQHALWNFGLKNGEKSTFKNFGKVMQKYVIDQSKTPIRKILLYKI